MYTCELSNRFFFQSPRQLTRHRHTCMLLLEALVLVLAMVLALALSQLLLPLLRRHSATALATAPATFRRSLSTSRRLVHCAWVVRRRESRKLLVLLLGRAMRTARRGSHPMKAFRNRASGNVVCGDRGKVLCNRSLLDV